MNSQERDIIDGIFERLQQAAGQPRDPETERYIADKLRRQPYAPYAMAQLIYVQEEAIKSLNAQLEELRASADRARSPSSGGILSSIFGGGRSEPPRPAGSPWGGQGGPAPGPGYGQPGYGQPGGYGPGQGGPWGGQPGGFAPQRGGSGFLGNALTTAAGVAGGMVVGNALMNAFSGHHAPAGMDTSGLSNLGGGDGFFGSGAGVTPASDSDLGAPLHGGSDAGFQDASFDNASDFDSGDLGSGSDEDWA